MRSGDQPPLSRLLILAGGARGGQPSPLVAFLSLFRPKAGKGAGGEGPL